MNQGILSVCICLPQDLQDPLLTQTPWLGAGQSRKKDDRVLNHFSLIRQKQIPLRTPLQSSGTWACSQSRVLVMPPENLMWFSNPFRDLGATQVTQQTLLMLLLRTVRLETL